MWPFFEVPVLVGSTESEAERRSFCDFLQNLEGCPPPNPPVVVKMRAGGAQPAPWQICVDFLKIFCILGDPFRSIFGHRTAFFATLSAPPAFPSVFKEFRRQTGRQSYCRRLLGCCVLSHLNVPVRFSLGFGVFAGFLDS